MAAATVTKVGKSEVANSCRRAVTSSWCSISRIYCCAGIVVAAAVTEICIANTIISGCLHFYSTSAFNLSATLSNCVCVWLYVHWTFCEYVCCCCSFVAQLTVWLHICLLTVCLLLIATNMGNVGMRVSSCVYTVTVHFAFGHSQTCTWQAVSHRFHCNGICASKRVKIFAFGILLPIFPISLVFGLAMLTEGGKNIRYE